MIESNCGIKCKECKYREKISCNTCLLVANPFWGDCPIKACAEEKNIKFCGVCKEFPCELLLKFAYDKEQGDNGLRIENCKQWKEKYYNKESDVNEKY